MHDLRYPIGEYQAPDPISPEQVNQWIDQMAALPDDLRAAVDGLDDRQLDTPYREGGWTLRQVVHHMADSQMNGFVRFKWALTEPDPMIKPYFEERWAEQAEYALPIDSSLDMVESLHTRWIMLLRSLDRADLKRTYRHPEIEGPVALDWAVGLYAWHGRHHLAHITELAEREGWR